jgi:hypothetical protein
MSAAIKDADWLACDGRADRIAARAYDRRKLPEAGDLTEVTHRKRSRMYVARAPSPGFRPYLDAGKGRTYRPWGENSMGHRIWGAFVAIKAPTRPSSRHRPHHDRAVAPDEAGRSALASSAPFSDKVAH